MPEEHGQRQQESKHTLANRQDMGCNAVNRLNSRSLSHSKSLNLTQKVSTPKL